jgi:hypothetical protein
MEFDFDAYIRDFNANEDDAVLAKYFTEDLILEGPDRTMHGRDEWLGMLKFMHAGVREELQPQLVVRHGKNLMTEVNAVFTALEDRPDFFFGPLQKGAILKMKFFAVYRLRGHQIAHLTLAFWAPGLRAI